MDLLQNIPKICNSGLKTVLLRFALFIYQAALVRKDLMVVESKLQSLV